MTTVRQLQKQWDSRKYRQLFTELSGSRPEAAIALYSDDLLVAAAAMAVIRLEELNQSHVALCGKLLRAVLAAQQPDGGWGEPLTTALAICALTCSQGQGAAIDRGVEYLANLQQPAGSWPRIPIRRMSADALVTAYLVLKLGNMPAFQRRIRITDAINWLIDNTASLDSEARRIWERARTSCRIAKRSQRFESPQLWS
jgi:hypothetical protein